MTEKSILLTLTYLVGIGELVLAVFFWVTNSKNEIRRVMAVFAFFMGLWMFLNSFIAYNQENSFPLLFSQLSFVFGILLVTAFLHLTIVFPYKFIRFDRLHTFLLYLPSLIFSLIVISTTTIIKATVFSGPNDVGSSLGGQLFPFFNLYTATLFITGLALLIFQIRRSDGMHKKNVSLVFWSVIFGGLPGVYLALVSPTFALPSVNYLYGNLATLIWLISTTYIVLKK